MSAGADSVHEPPAASNPIWKAPAADLLLWISDGAEAIVFDRRSRQTHVLNAVATASLRILLQGPLDQAGLVRELATLVEPDLEGELPGLAAAVVSTFDALGLIEPTAR